jgi:peroxiredoxin family protein/TusA-related sulfurtransferase
MTTPLTTTITLDFKGLSCPLPIVKTAVAIKHLQPGELIEVLATDAGSVADFTAWSRPPATSSWSTPATAAPTASSSGKDEPAMTDTQQLKAAVAASQARPKANKLVIFTWGGDLDKVWPTLILATSAAAMGMETIVFFTFWGLFPLVRNDVRLTGDNWMQKAMSLLHRGGTQHLRLSQLNFVGAGPAMMRKLAADHQVASPQELLALAQEMGVRLIPCQMTMDLLGLTREDMIDGLEEPAGAATALAEAQDAITLFI